MAKLCGIYKVTSPVGRIYIGRSVDIHKRWRDYKYMWCKEQRRLYNSLKKYGFENHKFEIIHQCASDQLDKLEKEYVDMFQTFNTRHGLNLRDGGGNKGAISEEQKRRISEAQMGEKNHRFGKHHSIESKQNLSKKIKGKARPKEHGMKISKALKGKKKSEKAKQNMSASAKNKPPMTVVTKLKMSESHKGIKFSDKRKQNISESLKGERHPLFGKHHSENTKLKISIAGKGRKQTLEQIKKRVQATSETKATIKQERLTMIF